MFAQRTNWRATPLESGSGVAENRPPATETAFDLTETNPTRCGFAYLDAALEVELATPGARVYAPHPAGLRSARDAIAGLYAVGGRTPDPDRVLLTAGTSEGYAHLMRLLLNPGDALLVPSPSYPLLDLLAQLHDIRLVPYPLHYDGRWWIDLEALRALIDGSTRAIVVISPNNPTGSYLKTPEHEALVTFAAAHDLALIADEVFGDYALATVAARAPSLAHEDRCLTFTLNGISKLLGLPQMKLAWITINGPAARAAEACRRLEIIADTFLSVGTPVQLALPAWLARRAAVQSEIRARVRTNLATAGATLRHAQCLHVEGGWCAILRIPQTSGADAFARALLLQDGVRVDPGALYGLTPDAYVVISLLPPPAAFAEGLRRLDARAAAVMAG